MENIKPPSGRSVPSDERHTPAAHTKGPYQLRFVEGGYRRKERFEIRTVTAGIGESIALVRTNNYSRDRDTAAFIVRACNAHDDMKEALEQCEREIRRLHDLHGGDDRYGGKVGEPDLTVAEAARAALSRASDCGSARPEDTKS